MLHQLIKEAYRKVKKSENRRLFPNFRQALKKKAAKVYAHDKKIKKNEFFFSFTLEAIYSISIKVTSRSFDDDQGITKSSSVIKKDLV
ncbi:hypothetical protein [Acinetobacter sp. ASP199]|uniref:hypothetical protein n=1 Tax=unclassified Acinetobacter TaxID=196816 RepID=UPI001F61975B|nr:hypothetical protein [Acinetobacter sp. ASP199]UNT60020.1 hypothetical protein IHE35_04110 [Acinetobacter sp. ASP199]